MRTAVHPMFKFDRFQGRQWLDTIRFAIIFAIAYFLLDRIAFIYPLRQLNITPWDPQPALAVALLYLRGWRWLPWVYIAALLPELVAREDPLLVSESMLLTLVIIGGYSVTAGLMRSFIEVTPELGTRQDVINLMVAVVIGSGTMALWYAGLLCAWGIMDWEVFPVMVFRYWLGETIGLLVTMPLILFFAEPSRRRELSELAGNRRALLPLGLIVAALLVVFLRDESQQYKYFYLLFLPIIWIASRYGVTGAITGAALIQLGVVIAAMASNHELQEILELQTLLLCLVLTGLILGAAVDEWRDAFQRLSRARELTAVGEMATAVAHELNQPLTALSTYCDAMRLLAEHAPEDRTRMVATADRIRRVATRCAEIVARFRTFAPTRVDTPERASVADNVRSAIVAMQERLDQARAEISLKADASLPAAPIDRERMGLVFQNLIGNALDAARTTPNRRPTIDIVVRRDGRRHVRVTFRDSGPGIPIEMIERIFEPFFTGKATGMGLGLAICRSIVENHGGRLWAEPGKNGILHVRLPI
jgi:signal transduction histidine kinase